MSRPSTDYGIRVLSHDEIREAFGTLARAADITGGDLHTLLFYFHNRELIDGAAKVERQPGEFATEFCEAANVERAAAAYSEMAKPTITAVADQVGVCRSVARRLLMAAGKVAP
ncbi:hypothetical protein V3391_06720 [Luteimonas sp. SMYT11W]|uniref:Uncharacterized protein n=1 Tax=Luteimonas flava TaxID=3115822 RepID=A0ABU7WE32_9GAMM